MKLFKFFENILQLNNSKLYIKKLKNLNYLQNKQYQFILL